MQNALQPHSSPQRVLLATLPAGMAVALPLSAKKSEEGTRASVPSWVPLALWLPCAQLPHPQPTPDSRQQDPESGFLPLSPGGAALRSLPCKGKQTWESQRGLNS